MWHRKKSKKTKYILIAAAVLLLLFFFIISSSLDTHDLCFFVGDDKHIAEGKVFLDGRYLGDTVDGCLEVATENYSEGELTLLGEYKGRTFEHVFYVSKKDLNQIYLNYVVGLENLEGYELNFFREDTNDSLDGDVYLNNKQLGETTNGTLIVELDDLFPGTITLNVKRDGESNEFYFEFKKEDLGYGGKKFYVKKEDLTYAELDPSLLNEDAIGEKITDLVNAKRKKQGLNELGVSKELSTSALNYLEEVTSAGFDPSDKKPIINILSEDGIFSFYAISVAESKDLNPVDDEDSIARHIVNKLFEDAWSKDTLLSEYSDIGVGVYFIDKGVLALAFLSVTEYTVELTADKNTCTGLNQLYNKALPYEKDIKIKFKLNSSERVSAHIITNENEQNKCVRRKPIDSIKSYKLVTSVDDEIVLPKGSGLMIESNKYKDANYEFTVKFISWG